MSDIRQVPAIRGGTPNDAPRVAYFLEEDEGSVYLSAMGPEGRFCDVAEITPQGTLRRIAGLSGTVFTVEGDDDYIVVEDEWES